MTLTWHKGLAAALVASAFAAGGAPAGEQPAFNADCGGTPCRVESLPSRWEVLDVGPDLRTLTVMYESGNCWHGNALATARETSGRISVAVMQDRVVAMDTPDGSFACTADLRYRTTVLALRRRVDGRAIAGSPRIGRGTLGRAPRSPRVLDMRAADAARALRVQGLIPQRVGRTRGPVTFQSPLPRKRLGARRVVRLTVGRRLFRGAALQGCLERAGIPTLRGAPDPGDADAPDLVLWLRSPNAQAEVGLYADAARAAELAPTVRRSIRRAGGVFERNRYVSIVWYEPPVAALREQTRACVFGPLGRPRS
jgi:hypothetical protein